MSYIYSIFIIFAFAFVSVAQQFEKRQFIAVPRIGRSHEDTNTSGLVKLNPPSTAVNKILNHIYSDLLKRQGYIPTPRVGRSSKSLLNDDKHVSSCNIVIYELLTRFPALISEILNSEISPRYKRSINYDNELDNIEINKRQFLPPPRIGRRSNDFKETFAKNQVTSNSIEGSNIPEITSNLFQDETNIIEPNDLQTMSKILKWLNLSKGKQSNFLLNSNALANALSNKRGEYSSRLSRSAPLTPRLGRSYWDIPSVSEENNDEKPSYYDVPINNRMIRTALTPRLGRSIRAAERVV